MWLDLVILIVCSIAITALGLLILFRNPSQPNNRQFAYLSIALVFWTVANYFSDHATSHILLYTRLTFLGGLASIYTLLKFISNFSNNTGKYRIFLRIHTVFTLVLLPVIFTPLFVKSVSVNSGGGSINTNYLYSLFLVFVAYSFIITILVIRQQIIKPQSLAQKQQILFISWGIILYAIFAGISNVILPLVVNDWSSSRFGPVFTLYLVGTVAYAIVKHKLFDIRPIVARSIAYAFTILVAVLIYGFIAFGIVARLLFKNQHFDFEQQIIFSTLSVVLIFAFPKIQSFFNRSTNRLFYRDAYDTQAFLDEFNKTLVSTYDLNKLLLDSADTIEQILKPAFCVFVIKSTEMSSSRIIGGSSNQISDSINISHFNAMLKDKPQLTITDELSDGQTELKKILLNNKISLVSKLSASTNHKEVGYIILGPKKSGNLYSSQDTKVIEILTNELVIAVQNALRFEEIQHFNITLQDKVDEATKKLRETNKRLKLLDETKDDFISMASHQLRTPLTSVKGYLSLVLDGDAGDISDSQRKLLTQAFFSSQRMVFLIADLLNVSRLKTGKFIIERTFVNLADIIEQELAQLVETAKGRELTLEYKKPDNFPSLNIDETKTRQVIMNFCDNAIYYTPAGGHIIVQLENLDKSIELKVIDNGMGVPKVDQHHLFGKFYRAKNAQKARPDGTGLGLFMAKKIIVAQGGAIIFTSQEGKGSTFGFTFPKAGITEPTPPAQNLTAHPAAVSVAKEQK